MVTSCWTCLSCKMNDFSVFSLAFAGCILPPSITLVREYTLNWQQNQEVLIKNSVFQKFRSKMISIFNSLVNDIGKMYLQLNADV